jgi:hypothetical protein
MGFNPFKALGKVVKGAAAIGSVVPGPWQLPAMAASAGLQAIGGAQKGASADKRRQQALDIRLGEWNAGAPLRARARDLAMAGPPARRDLSATFMDPTNPYARLRAGSPPPAVPAMPPAQEAPLSPPFDPRRPLRGPVGRTGPVFRGGVY